MEARGDIEWFWSKDERALHGIARLASRVDEAYTQYRNACEQLDKATFGRGPEDVAAYMKDRGIPEGIGAEYVVSSRLQDEAKSILSDCCDQLRRKIENELGYLANAMEERKSKQEEKQKPVVAWCSLDPAKDKPIFGDQFFDPINGNWQRLGIREDGKLVGLATGLKLIGDFGWRFDPQYEFRRPVTDIRNERVVESDKVAKNSATMIEQAKALTDDDVGSLVLPENLSEADMQQMAEELGKPEFFKLVPVEHRLEFYEVTPKKSDETELLETAIEASRKSLNRGPVLVVFNGGMDELTAALKKVESIAGDEVMTSCEGKFVLLDGWRDDAEHILWKLRVELNQPVETNADYLYRANQEIRDGEIKGING